jgi:hypothetical protein
MPYTAEQLLKISHNYEKIGTNSLVSSAKGKEKKKLDPHAKVRNRGYVCVPAEKALDHKDHFPANDEAQARNALARVHQYSSAPSWYKGSLKGLQDLISRKVHSKYPGISKDKKSKKSSVEISDVLLNKYSQTATPTVNVEDLPKASAPTKAQYPTIDKTFQVILGVDPDGSLGPITQKALDAYKAKVNPNNPTMNNQLAFEFLKREPQYQTKQLLPANQSSITNAATQSIQLLESIAQVFARVGSNGLGEQDKQIINTFIEQYSGLREQLGREQLSIKDTDQNAFNQAEGTLFQAYKMIKELAQMSGIAWGGNSISRTNRTATSVDNLIAKYASVSEITSLLNRYEGTGAFLRDLAKAQFELVGLDQNQEPEENWKTEYESSKKLHDMIMAFADQVEAEESKYW